MKLVDYRIEAERCAFIATGRPGHAWAAYGIARQAKMGVPEWVLEYLDKARVGLVFNVADAVEATGTKKNLAPVVARAFGFVSDGRGTPFDYDRKWWLYGRTVWRLMTKGIEGQERGGGLSLYHAKERATKIHGVSFATISRHFETFARAFPDGDDYLVIDEDDLPEPDDGDRPPLVPMDE